MVCAEWPEYAAISPERLRDLLEYPIVVDARNVWDRDALEAAGLTVAAWAVPSPRAWRTDLGQAGRGRVEAENYRWLVPPSARRSVERFNAAGRKSRR